MIVRATGLLSLLAIGKKLDWLKIEKYESNKDKVGTYQLSSQTTKSYVGFLQYKWRTRNQFDHIIIVSWDNVETVADSFLSFFWSTGKLHGRQKVKAKNYAQNDLYVRKPLTGREYAITQIQRVDLNKRITSKTNVKTRRVITRLHWLRSQEYKGA